MKTLINHTKKLFGTMFFLLANLVAFSNHHVSMSMKNISCSDRQIEFDLILTNDGNSSVSLSACSFGINFNASLVNEGQLTFEAIPSSQNKLLGSLSLAVKKATDYYQARLTSNPLRFSQTLELAKGTSFNIGRFVVRNSNDFEFNNHPEILLSEETSLGYTTTQLIAYIDGNTKLIALSPKTKTVSTDIEMSACIPGQSKSEGNPPATQTQESTGRKAINTRSQLTDEALTLYPNPSSDIINLGINTSSGGEIEISIADMQGRLQKRILTNLSQGHNSVEMDIQHFASGMYTLQVSGASGKWHNIKFVRR